MKKYIQILLYAVLTVLPFSINAQVDIAVDDKDATITKSNTIWGWVGQTTARIGSTNDQCYVMPVLLPAIPAGQELISATLTFKVISWSNNSTTSKIDLYGLGYRATADVDLVADYYAGVNDVASTKLQDEILIPSTVPASGGVVSTDASGSTALLNYIKAQYTAGGTGNYIFIRLSSEMLSDAGTWNIHSQNAATPADRPFLTLTFGTADGPTFNTPLANQTVDEGSTTIINYSVTDPNGDALSVTYTNLPSFATTSFTDNGDGTGDGTITLAPQSGDAGNHNNVTIIVDDGNGNTSDEVFNIEVVNPYIVTLTASISDGYVSDPSIVTTDNPYIFNHLKVGSSDVVGDPNLTSAIIPFQLPAIPSGKTGVVGAQLKIYVPFGREYVNSNIDLYGLTYSSSNTISSSDYYSGNFTSGPSVGNGLDYGIESNFISKQNVLGYKDISRFVLSSNQVELADYINKQYDAGAVEGDWVFLRLSVNNESMIPSQYFAIDGADGTSVDVNGNSGARSETNKAELIIDFGNTIRTNIETQWDGSSWSNNEPNSKTTAIVDSYLEVGEGLDIYNILANNITVTSTGELHIFNGSNVFVLNNLTINAGGKVVVENGGSFNTKSSLFSSSINGEFEVIRESRATKNNFTYWSSPVNTTVQNALINSGSPMVYKYDTSAFDDADDDGYDDDRNSWVAVTSDVMTPGVGYAAKGSDDGTTPSVHTVTYKAGDGTGSKTINSSNVVVPIVLSNDANGDTDDDFDDWNLLGNPYATAISAREFINSNSNITKTLYFWTHTTDETNAGYEHSDYAYYNLAGGVYPSSSTGDGNSGIIPTGLIASGQGFMLDAITAGDVTFTPDMQVFSLNTNDNNNFYKKSSKIKVDGNIVEDRVWISLSNGFISNQILIGFFDDASVDYDNGYDAPNLDSGNDIDFYTMLEGKPYSIQGFGKLDKNQTVDLGMRIDEGSSTSFTLSIDNVEGNLINKSILVTDRITGETLDLQKGDYIFTTEQFGEINDRFEVSFVDSFLDDNNLDLNKTISISPNPIINNFEIVGLNSSLKSIIVLSLRGEKLLEIPVNNMYDLSMLPTGVYLLKLELSNETIIKKVIKR